jgi:hypothetical protein
VVNQSTKRATLSKTGALRHRSPSPVLTARLPSRLNSLDKRAVCTTSVEFDVDAAVNDRTTSTCGVSDVLSASPFGMGASSMMPFLPRLSNSHKSEYPSSCLPRCRSRRPGTLEGVRCCYTSWSLQKAETIVARRCTCTLCMLWYLRDTDLVSCQNQGFSDERVSRMSPSQDPQ